MPSVILLPRAEVQILDVLSFTREQFGEAKYVEYQELIELALEALEVAPTAGKRDRTSTPTHGPFTSPVIGG